MTVVHKPPLAGMGVTACCGVLITQVPEDEDIAIMASEANCTVGRICCGGDVLLECYGDECPTPCSMTADGKHVPVPDDPLPEGHPMAGVHEPGERCSVCSVPIPQARR